MQVTANQRAAYKRRLDALRSSHCILALHLDPHTQTILTIHDMTLHNVHNTHVRTRTTSKAGRQAPKVLKPVAAAAAATAAAPDNTYMLQLLFSDTSLQHT